MKIKLRIFLEMGFPLGIIMGIYYGISHEFILGIINGVFSFVLCGLMMSAYVYYNYKKIADKANVSIETIIETTKHSCMIELNCDYDNAYNKCLESIKIFDKSRILVDDRENGIIKIKTKCSFKSYGEKIDFNIVTKENNKIEINVYSAPSYKFTKYDYGINYFNIKKIKEKINQMQ